MYSIIFLVGGFHMKSQQPFILPQNMSSICWSSVNRQILSYLLISVWIKLKIKGQVTPLHLPLSIEVGMGYFLRLELCSGNQLLKTVFGMIFRISGKETFSPRSHSGEIGSWGLNARILEGATGLDKNDGCCALSRSPLIPWACFCRLCFSRSAPLTLFEWLPWATKFTPPGHLHAPSAWVVHACGSPVLLPQVGMNPETRCLIQSFIWDQAETGTFPKITPCSIYSPSLSYFLHSFTSVFWEHFLCNVLHMTWMAHKSSSPGLFLSHVSIKRRWCWMGMGVGKNISSGVWKTWDFSEFLCYQLFVVKFFLSFLNSPSLSLLICKMERTWSPW